jgi:hypothetical protein
MVWATRRILSCVRAVEPRPEGDHRKGFDSVILAADQRTLILDLNVAPDKIDQLRVIVEADYSPITEMRDLSP